jgi:hypothetical protein
MLPGIAYWQESSMTAPTPSRRKAAAKKIRNYRSRLRARELRPVQIWLPDTRDPAFAAEMRRQSLLVSGPDSDTEALDIVEAFADDIET